jgi:hypothetical protein
MSLNEGTTGLILENNSLRHSLFNDDNKRGGNKLRTYRKLKK